MSGSPINWGPVPAGHPMLQHPLYLKYSNLTIGQIEGAEFAALKTDLKMSIANNDTADIVAYLSWVIRLCGLVQ